MGGSADLAAWVPTHRVVDDGLDAFDQPDAGRPVVARIDPSLEVSVVEWWGDWAQVRFSNGWTAWVDGRLLDPLDEATPAGPPPRVAGGGEGGAAVGSAERPAVGRGKLTIPALGAVAVLAGSALPWYSATGTSQSAWKVPFGFVLSGSLSSTGVKTGVVLLVGALGLLPLLAGRRFPPLLLTLAGGVCSAVALAALIRAERLPGTPLSLGAGLFAVLAGGVLVGAHDLLGGK